MRRSTLIALKVLTLAAVAAAILNLPGWPETRRRYRVYVVDASLSVRAAEGEAAVVPTVGLALDLIARDVQGEFAVVAFGGSQQIWVNEIPKTIEATDPHKTDVAAALAAARALVPADAAGEIVLFSDGRFERVDFDAPVVTIPLGAAEPTDARIAAVDHPAAAERFDARVDVAATRDTDGVLRLGERSQPVHLIGGARQAFWFKDVPAGSHVAELDVRDACPENNRWPFTVDASPARRILVLSGFDDSPAARVLGAIREGPLKSCDAVVIEELAADQVDGEALRRYVLDGGFLLTMGGSKSYALGGYAGTPIEDVSPVWAFPRDEFAVAIALDCSGSMASDDRMAIARRQLVEATAYLSPRDTLAIVAFSATARIVRPAGPPGSRADLARALESIKPFGATQLAPAAREAAAALRGVSAPTRLALFITDDTPKEDPDTIAAAFDELKREGIVAATVLTSDVNAIGAELQRIFARSRGLVLEDPAPGIRRANRVDARDEAQVVERVAGHPLAATRRVGRGRTAAVTFALTDEWGGPAELLTRLLPAASSGELISARYDGRAVTVRWNGDGPVTYEQNGRRGTARLSRRAPGEIEATIEPVRPGPLAIAGPTRLAFEVPYSPELSVLGRHDYALQNLARQTGGAFNALDWKSPERTRTAPGRALYAAAALALFLLEAILAVVWK